VARAIVEAGVNGEANPRFQLRPDGRLSWGIGGATPLDLFIERSTSLGSPPDRVLKVDEAIQFPPMASQPQAPGTAGLVTVGAFNDQLWAMFNPGISVALPLGLATGWVLGRNHPGYWLADTGASPFITDGGLLRGITVTGTPSRLEDAAGLGLYVRFTSGAVSGNDAGIEQTNAVLDRDFVAGTEIAWIYVKFRLPTITSVRSFIGLSDQSLATMVGADNPAGNYFGLHFSTPRGDANLQWVNKNGTTQTITNSTKPPGPWQFVRIRLTSSLMFAQLMDSNFQNPVAKLVTTNIPAKTVNMRLIAGVETETAAARDIDVAVAYRMGEH
jgi:hypothetical protein